MGQAARGQGKGLNKNMVENKNMVSIQGVEKRFGQVRAVDGVTMDIREGEFFALLGPSGCGKTTLLRVLGGFEIPNAGDIIIDGQSMAAVPAHQRPVNMVFQNYAIFPHLNVRQNIAYGLRKAKLSKDAINAKVDDALRMIKLEGYGDRSSDQLSGGQRQRVALARALIKQPKVLLLDEPLGALDKQLRGEMQLELRSLQKSLGITFIFVTHDQEEALSMSDRIAVMSQGKVLQIDTPERLYEIPVSRAVAEFIGTMNFFDGRVETIENDHIVIDAGPLGRVRAAPANEPNVGVGDMVSLGVRPEKLSIGDQPLDGEFNGVQGRLSASAYFGDRNHFYVEIDGLAHPVCVAAQNDAHHAGAKAGISDMSHVWLRWAVRGPVVLPRR